MALWTIASTPLGPSLRQMVAASLASLPPPTALEKEAQEGRRSVCRHLGKANDKQDLIFWKDKDESDLTKCSGRPP